MSPILNRNQGSPQLSSPQARQSKQHSEQDAGQQNSQQQQTPQQIGKQYQLQQIQRHKQVQQQKQVQQLMQDKQLHQGKQSLQQQTSVDNKRTQAYVVKKIAHYKGPQKSESVSFARTIPFKIFFRNNKELKIFPLNLSLHYFEFYYF